MSSSVSYVAFGAGALYLSFVAEAMKRQEEDVRMRLELSWTPPCSLQPPDLRDGRGLTDPLDIFHHLMDYRNLNLNPSKLSLAIAAAIR